MGGTSSKFRKALHAGDEKVAEEVYHGSVEFQKVFDPNTSYGENYGHNTALHYASRHGMHRLVRIFMQRHSGNPNKRNSDNQTSLHCICMQEQIRLPSSTYSYSQYYYSQPPEKKRLECARLVLGWRGIAMGEGEREQIRIDAVDEDGNTALHYAAGSGYLSLVEMLLENNASMFVENGDKETPCDSAERHQHLDIAQLLESKMVFSSPNNEEEVSEEIGAIQYEEAYTGLKHQDLQEAKDLVVVETADMLRVPLFTAEALLRNFEWSREALLESWIQSPEDCCERSGVKPPANLDRFGEEHQLTSLQPRTEAEQEDTVVCDICTAAVPSDEMGSDTLCAHQFCRECWERYLTGKIKEGNAHSIVCPGFDCDKLVPVEAIEKLVSREMARRYLQFDINAFVESNPKLKWCPVAGCGRAVQMPQHDPLSPSSAAMAAAGASGSRSSRAGSPTTPPSISHAVDCGQGHIFCWDCVGDAHEPCCCENWKKWLDKIAEIKPEELASTDNETELAANCLWLVTNSKPCPKCMAPIQKNDGCNHMKCTKCKHDFCWVCQEAWSKHSSETGGYFRCNRFEVVSKVDEKAESLLTDAERKHHEMQELNRFIHFYTRFKNHGHSHSLEEPLLRRANVKMRKLGSRSGPAGPEATKFIEESIHELLKARRVLRFSYPYGYYLEDRGGSKQIFEFMQNELEEATETLSQMVARHYLRTPRHKIVQAAQLVLRKRHEFLAAVSKGLLPPDNPSRPAHRPPSHQPSSWDSDSDEEDEAFRQAIEASLQEAVAQAESSSTDQTEESPLSFLDLHLSSGKKRHSSGSRDPGSMTEGLLRALEMSQLLLMQQTEQLQPNASTAAAAANAAINATSTAAADSNANDASTLLSHGLSTAGSSSGKGSKSTKVSSQTVSALPNQSGEGVMTGNSFSEDLRRAIQLSLQELESNTDADSTQSGPKADTRSSSGSSSSSSKSRRKRTGSREHRSSYESSRGTKSAGTATATADTTLGGALPAGLLDLSKELETEFERIKRKTLSPDEDVPAAAGEEEMSDAAKSPWELRMEERKRSRLKSPPQHPYVKKKSGSSSSCSSSSKASPLSSSSRKATDEAQASAAKSSRNSLSAESEEAVRAVRASSDPYAPAIRSLLTQLESQRAVSAEHVSKGRPQPSTATPGEGSTSEVHDAGSLQSVSAKPSKPVWLEGPLLVKPQPRKRPDPSVTPKPPAATTKTALSKSVSSGSSKPSSLNIELYMSRKATLEEELRREKAAKTSGVLKLDQGGGKPPSLSGGLRRSSEPARVLGKFEAAPPAPKASEDSPPAEKAAAKTRAESRSSSRTAGPLPAPVVIVADSSTEDGVPSQAARPEDNPPTASALEAPVTIGKEAQDSREGQGRLAAAASNTATTTTSALNSFPDGESSVKEAQPQACSDDTPAPTLYVPSDSPWEICQPEMSLARTTARGGGQPSPSISSSNSSRQHTLDKLSVRATAEKPIWERKEAAGETAQAGRPTSSDAAPSGLSATEAVATSSTTASASGISPEVCGDSNEPTPAVRRGSASGDKSRPGQGGQPVSPGPVWERGDGSSGRGNNVEEGGDSQVWQMFI